MAATLTPTSSGHRRDGIRTMSLAWVSHTDGVVNLDTPAVNGEILRVVIIPGAGGLAPTTLYDVLLNDAHGIDVLGGQGQNLSATVTSHVCPGVPLKDGTTTGVHPIAVAGVLTLVIANAGSGKAGTIVLYLA